MALDHPRLAPLEPGAIDPELWNKLGEMGQSLNIMRTIAHHPKLARRWLVLANHILYKNSLSGRVRELAILRIGWLCRSDYEFGQHTLIGLDEGLTAEEIRRLTGSPEDEGWTDLERLVLRATDELHADSMVSDATWAGLSAQLTTEQLMDLIFTVGQYQMVSMVLNTLGVQREPETPGFPDGA